MKKIRVSNIRSKSAELYIHNYLIFVLGIMDYSACRNISGYYVLANSPNNSKFCKIHIKYGLANNSYDFRFKNYILVFAILLLGNLSEISSANNNIYSDIKFYILLKENVQSNITKKLKVDDLCHSPNAKKHKNKNSVYEDNRALIPKYWK